MPLNSLGFLMFLATVFALYWGCTKVAAANRLLVQNLVLILSSLVFYAVWDLRFLMLLVLEISVAFGIGMYFGGRKSRTMMILATVFYIGILGYFKYAGFFVESLQSALSGLGVQMDWPTLNIIAPIGISFYTFMCLGYIIDTYLGRVEIQKNFIAFFAMMSFFPQIVAGPIGRVAHLAPQFSRTRTLDFDFASNGVCLFAYGLAKKMVVADTLGQYVDKVFAMPEYFNATSCLVAMLFFSIQIYCDFSGYSDMARGCARLFGIDLARNFDRPYAARSFSEFWHRWHISLSTWFRDYVYIPLGGSREGLFRLLRNTWVVFLLSGLWHGAAWTFVVWGGLHAAFLSLSVLRRHVWGVSATKDSAIKHVVDVIIVFSSISIAWVFFRAPSFATVVEFFCTIVSGAWGFPDGRVDGMVFYLTPYLLISLLGISVYLPVDCEFKSTRKRCLFVVACIAFIVFLGIPCGGEFIYQRF